MPKFEKGRLPRDDDRIDAIRRVLEHNNLHAVVCSLPANVLLLSGYWPVIGSAVAIVTREGAIAVIAPEDEVDLARNSWADVIHTFRPASLHELTTVSDAIRDPLRDLKQPLGIGGGASIGFEGGASFEPSTYASMFLYGPAMQPLLASAFPAMTSVDVTGELARLRSVLTARELERVRQACAVARTAFLRTAADIQPGMREFAIADLLRSRVSESAADRSGGFAWCMSGPNAARAYAAFQKSTDRVVRDGDAVLLHCNSYLAGFWTDITRTFWIGGPDDDQAAITDAVLTAGRAAIAAVHPGARACHVDFAARAVLDSRGFGKQFKHATGHGVGFAAINHNAPPRIHPLSDEVLQPGMVFNVEPAVYIDGRLGFRHCDMVAVTDTGAEVLTAFQSEASELAINETEPIGR